MSGETGITINLAVDGDYSSVRTSHFSCHILSIDCRSREVFVFVQEVGHKGLFYIITFINYQRLRQEQHCQEKSTGRNLADAVIFPRTNEYVGIGNYYKPIIQS